MDEKRNLDYLIYENSNKNTLTERYLIRLME